MNKTERNPTCYCCGKDLVKAPVFERFSVAKKYNRGFKDRQVKDITLRWPCNCQRNYDKRCVMCHRCQDHDRCLDIKVA